MSSQLRLFCRIRTSRSCPGYSHPLCQRRALSYSLPHRTDLSPEPASLEESEQAEEYDEAFEAQMAAAEAQESVDPEGGEGDGIQSYRDFMATFAQQYRTAAPQQWLGREGPFPLNQSFKPPPPLSDTLKERMYEEYMMNPQKNNIRALSQRYHVSLKRVDAILRLKGMEKDWIKGKPLQTGFVRGMEKLLSVRTATDLAKEKFHARYDTQQADTLEEAENRDAARQRYQRSYWESTPESGGEPIVPASVEHAKRMAVRMAERARKEKDAKYLPPIADTEFIKWPKEPVVVAKKVGRPDVHFIDVGAKFVDSVAEDKRVGRAATRARFKGKKAALLPS